VNPADAVFFAVRSAVRLGRQLRQAYVDSTRSREISLPLPDFDPTLNETDARQYFHGAGAAHLADRPGLRRLVDQERLDDASRAALLEAFRECSAVDAPGEVGSDELRALFAVRQWTREPNPSALQRLAGTLIETAVEWFADGPGALRRESREGRALGGLLDALHQIPFAETPLPGLPGRLLTAALESASELPPDPRVRDLVRAAALGLSREAARRVEAMRTVDGADLAEEQSVGEAAEGVFRSVLSSAGSLVLADPARYLGLGDGALVRSAGGALMELALEGRGTLGTGSLGEVARAALVLLGERPELAGAKGGLAKLLGETARALAAIPGPLGAATLPAAARIVLEKTGDNLDLVWPRRDDPASHVLLAAAKETLEVLAEGPAFGRPEAEQVLGAVLEGIAGNPLWAKEPGARTLLEPALGALRKHGVSPGLAADVLRDVATRTAARMELGVLSGPLVDAVLTAFLRTGRAPSASWQLARPSTLEAAAGILLRRAAKGKLDGKTAAKAAAAVEAYAKRVDKGEAWDEAAFEEMLGAVFAAGKKK
jgi:hypothetical protein